MTEGTQGNLYRGRTSLSV